MAIRKHLIAGRLSRRANPPEDPKRLDLLAKILEDSSSISLNNVASQLSARQAIENHARLFGLLDELKRIEANINPSLPCRNDEKWSKFFDWIDERLTTENGAKLSANIGVIKQQVQRQDSHQDEKNGQELATNHDEHCLVTKVPFKKGEKVFAVDRRIMLTTETAMKDSDLFDFVANDSIASEMQNVVLVLHLLNEFSKRENSFWWPYLSILPSKLLPILTLDKDELKYLLTSTHLFDGLKMIRAIARQYSYFYKRLQSTKLPLKKDFTFAYYAWGVSVVCSRQNEIPTADRQACLSPIVHALIPILDMCNHDCQSDRAIFQNNQSCLITTKELKANDEITINYGCRSSGEFFIHNGFVPNVVPLDTVPLTINLTEQDDLFDKKKKLLKLLNMPICARFKLLENNRENRNRRDPHLTMFLIVYYLNNEELDYLNNSQNPVGVADEIYDYVHHGSLEEPIDVEKSPAKVTLNESNDEFEMMDKMKKRLAECVQKYLTKRAAISVALINRAAEVYCSRYDLKGIDNIDNPAVRLLLREKSVFESYIS